MTNIPARIRFRFWTIAAAMIATMQVVGVQASVADNTSEIKTSGTVLRVCAMAYKDFTKHVAEEAKEPDPSGVTADERDFDNFMNDIGNYEVLIQSRRDVYDVIISPMAYPKGLAFGGGGEYWISGKDFTIRKKLFFK
jgi:hypothetical protein